ncbi:enoyl-CoA hydratase/isomerase family protein [Dactylosporangium sp. CA-092794]|uniref:enoyl-CoA hydratase/isomerase family protein n=1 Tax=Dactylosporangium sp. CA-092794 TaxID=3239929 RepID=UPI003D9449CC
MTESPNVSDATGQVRVGLEAAVGHVEICRPEKKNAMTTAIGAQLWHAVDRLGADPGCHAIVLYGRGGDLSSGADLSERLDPVEASRPWASQPHAQLFRALSAAPVPVIAVIDGWAIGMGLALVGAATYAVAGVDSRFWLPEIRSQYLPHAVLPHLLHRVPAEVAVVWAVAGTVFTSAEAVAARLVTHTAEAGQALTAALEVAAPFVAAPRPQVEQAMGFLRASRDTRGTAQVTDWCDQQMDLMLRGGGEMDE